MNASRPGTSQSSVGSKPNVSVDDDDDDDNDDGEINVDGDESEDDTPMELTRCRWGSNRGLET